MNAAASKLLGPREDLVGADGRSLLNGCPPDWLEIGPAARELRADTAMYRAKHLGRDGYQLYMPAMNERAAEQMSLETDLHGALRLGELIAHFQPIVDAATGRVAGTEALVHWQNPRRGLLQPGDFVPLAEETGLIGAMGAWVLEQACRATKGLRARGLPDLRVAVYLSARLGATIAIAHGLGLEVIAEGVETEEQRQLLQQAGCDFCQGYLFSRPLPQGELETFLAARPAPPARTSPAPAARGTGAMAGTTP